MRRGSYGYCIGDKYLGRKIAHNIAVVCYVALSPEATALDDRATPNFLEVLGGHIGQDGKADVVLGKSLSLLSESELFEPVSNLHRGPMFRQALGSPNEQNLLHERSDRASRTSTPALHFGWPSIGRWRHPRRGYGPAFTYRTRGRPRGPLIFGAPRPQSQSLLTHPPHG